MAPINIPLTQHWRIILPLTSAVGIILYLYLRGKRGQKKALSPSRSRSIGSVKLKRGKLSKYESFNHPEIRSSGSISSFSSLVSGKYDMNNQTIDINHKKDKKVCIVMVGLPGRGKTFVARKVARYLKWISYRTAVFSLAKYRLDKIGRKGSDFFNPQNVKFYSERVNTLRQAIDDLISYLNRDGDVAILDGTNTTFDRRKLIRERLTQDNNYEILWIESINESAEFLTQWKLEQSKSPDYISDEDFEQRLKYYQDNYTPLEEVEGSYMKVFDNGRKLELSNIHGYTNTKIAGFVLNLHTTTRPIFLVRHGESEHNVKGIIGGGKSASSHFNVYLCLSVCRSDGCCLYSYVR